MKFFLKIAGIFILLVSCEKQKEDKILDFQTPFEVSKGEETATYKEVIDFYIRLAKEFPDINVQNVGETDNGYPLHMVTYNPDGDFNFQKISKNKIFILINNGIHPGESDGIDATMLLYRDLVTKKIMPPKNTVLVTIPVYNVAGALNRNTTTRVNQNGPKSYGFRGNAQNYDLNRDFIKTDTKNSRTFAAIYHLVKPDIFIENHVSNGADYQYTLTHLLTQHNKLGGELGTYLNEELMPKLETALLDSRWDISPYVNVYNTSPENGFSQFMDSPRYSSGYTTLWNTLGMMVETHMLKPYAQRVEGTYQLMTKVIGIAETDIQKIKSLRKETSKYFMELDNYPLHWTLDSTKVTPINFKGFEVELLPSEITGFPRLKYDRTRPYTKEIPYYNSFVSSHSVKVPAAYIIGKGWSRVIDLLELNQITVETLTKDTTILVESYKIDSYKTVTSAFEGHYPHFNTAVKASLKKVKFSQGDYIVSTSQPGIRYLLETLEPEGTDSFFNWNFFDAILQRKEHISPYVFEDIALEILNSSPRIKETFLFKKATDKEFSASWEAQLNWLYEKSDYSEPSYLQYPIYRVLKDSLPVTE